MTNPEPATIARDLVEWHATHQRTLPWRDAPAGQRAAYAVWVSEIMLQQTRVETVVGYFDRWMARFPTVEALAAADLQAVLKQWEGLGYYARVRNLHRAAQIVVAEFGGRLPETRAALLKLPGIGAYTAGAIASIAFNRAEPILDGNVKRVLARLFDVDAPVAEPAVVDKLWALARAIVESAPPGAAGATNEALMELGALLCTPQQPRCLLCPLAAHCLAAARGTQAVRPVMAPRKRTPHYDVAAGAIWQGEPFLSPLLLAQRPQKGLLGGLWEFPGGKLEPDDADLPACLRREIREELELDIAVEAQFATVRHAYTHFRITLHAFHARFLGGEPRPIGCADWRWVPVHEIDGFPLPVTDRQLLTALLAEMR